MPKKVKKGILRLVKAGAVTGIGIGALGGVGGETAGLTAIAGQYGTVGTVMGGGMLLRAAKGLAPKKRKRRKIKKKRKKR